jgi:hypothetical protein
LSKDATGLTTPERVRDHLQLGKSTHNNLIESLIEEVTDEIEAGIDAKILAASYEETIDGQTLGPLVLQHTPVIRFIKLVLNGTTVDASTYEVDEAEGLVKRVTDGVESTWAKGTRNYVATYQAGHKVIPPGLRGIATEIVGRRLFRITKKKVGIDSEDLTSGGSASFESTEISDAEWKKLRRYV